MGSKILASAYQLKPEVTPMVCNGLLITKIIFRHLVNP